MNHLQVVIAAAIVMTLAAPAAKSSMGVAPPAGLRGNAPGNPDACKLHGKVQFVTSFPDYKIQVVTSFPDIKVKKVSSFPDDPGEWEIVDSSPDFTVQLVDSFPDFTVEYVDSFPGCP